MISIHERVKSGFDLSIGTGLAFETIFNPVMEIYDENRVVPDKLDLKDYKEIYINIRTLYRNLLASLPINQDFSDLAIAKTLLEELVYITQLVNTETNNKIKCIYYYIQYENSSIIKSKLTTNAVILRRPTTPGQILYSQKFDRIYTALKRINSVIEISSFANKPEPSQKNNSVIFTHYPFDLTGHGKFDKLTLLESNTGAFKNKTKYYTKFFNIRNKDLISIPFHDITLFIMGDNVLFHPHPLSIRNKILDLSLTAKWTSLTSREGVLQTLSMVNDKDIKTIYMKLIS